MQLHRLVLAALLPVAVLACGGARAGSSETPPRVREDRERVEAVEERTNEALISELSRGVWGWPDGAGSCDSNPHAISFSDDRSAMHITSAHATELVGSSDRTSTYDITFFGDDVVRGQIRGETRRTPAGKLVAWDLQLLAEGAYCWHRTDWPAGHCTRTLRRCPGLDTLPTDRADPTQP